METRHRPVVVTVLGLLLSFLLIGGAFAYSRWQSNNAREANAQEQRRQDYALCTVANQDRAAVRKAAAIQYATVSSRLELDPPSRELRHVFNEQLTSLQQLIKAQRPLDCSSYVSPNIPPDLGVD